MWLFQCDCGNTKELAANRVVSGRIKSCGCMAIMDRLPNGKPRTNTVEQNYIALTKLVWRRLYAYDGLSYEEFMRLSQLPCYYCNRAQTNIRKWKGAEFRYNGLDRIDNNLNHMLSNVSPCCWMCNCMRGSLPREEFIAHIERIMQHTKLSLAS